jgi:hypothetical protein
MNNSILQYRQNKYWDGTESYSEAFDPYDPSLMDRYPTYDTDGDVADRPPTMPGSF